MKNKNILSFVLVTLFLCFTNLATAQSEIYGTWTGYCALEKTTISSICACGICTTKKIDDATVQFKNIMITITEKTIKLGSNAPVEYKWDKDTDGIKFLYEKVEETFKVLTSAAQNTLVWKDPKNGCILILQRK
jgi:hypothetical protein